MQPGGHSTLERHEHVHAVVIFRGRGTCLVGDEVREVGAPDLVFIPPMTWHQFRASAGEPFGFLCMVNAERDKPQLPSADELRQLKEDPGHRRFSGFLALKRLLLPYFEDASHSFLRLSMTKIFISYRREDAKLIVGRIFDRLKAKFGREGVFMDIDSMPAGVDFRTHLGRELSQASAALVLIGQGWADARDEHGRRRLENPDDFVRIEIETMLKRGIPLVPVLFGGAPMPRPSQLPESMQPLLFRNALQLDVGRGFHFAYGAADCRSGTEFQPSGVLWPATGYWG